MVTGVVLSAATSAALATAGILGTATSVGLGLALLVVAFATAGWRWWTRAVIVTDLRVQAVRRGPWIVADSVHHEAVGDVQLRWTYLGRLLRYADLILRLSGRHEPAIRVRRVWQPESTVAAIRMLWFDDPADRWIEEGEDPSNPLLLDEEPDEDLDEEPVSQPFQGWPEGAR